jgi:Domain of unknown function (DUF4169)
MGEVINLNKARKARDKAAGKDEAQENRAKFGLTKLVRGKTAADKAKREKALDGRKLDGEVPS